MALNVKPGYINPLTTMGQKKYHLGVNQPQTVRKDDRTGDVKQLQTKRQTLQNQMLLMKGTTNSATAEESQQVLERALEEVSAELKTAEGAAVRAPEAVERPAVGSRFDSYVQQEQAQERPGLYRLEQDKKDGYRVLFEPYTER